MADTSIIDRSSPSTSGIASDEVGVEDEELGTADSIREPFDPTLIRVETKVTTVDLLMARIREKEIDLMPDFQRKAGLWKPAAQSRLIESLLIRIPLPAFYMDATNENRWLVVDGLQRLTTLKNFILEPRTLFLTGMEFLTNLNRKGYLDLPRNFQRRIAETQVTVYLIDEGTPPEVKFNIFKRINTGGLPLSTQEIRHALNQGLATTSLAKFASVSAFRQATGDAIPNDRMGDREFVLRFLAFATTPYTEYKSQDFDAFLNQKMTEFNGSTQARLDDLGARFVRTMELAHKLFGTYAFRKRYKNNDRKMPINKALFEAWSVNLDRLTDAQAELLLSRKEALHEGFTTLMNDLEFTNAISQGTGDVAKVKTRFSRIERLIEDTLK